MNDTTQRQAGDRIDRYIRGELSAVEARQLAQDSLEDPDLFEELTSCALANHLLSLQPVPAEAAARFPQRNRWLIFGSIAAAMVVAFYWKPAGNRPASGPPDIRSAQNQAPVPSGIRPAIQFQAGGAQPVLLAANLQNPPGAPQEAFRGTGTRAHAPRPSGTVVSVEDGAALIDLGSLDGLATGSALDVPAGGRVIVTAVFRERARGRVEGRVRTGQEVRVSPADHGSARLEQVETLARQGDWDAARTAAEETIQWAGSADFRLERRSEMWNTLAALRILHGDDRGGELLLNEMQASAAGRNAESAQIWNNLGVLAEVRGDRREAAARYRNALQAVAAAPALASTPQARQIIESNLARVTR